ncbi:ribonuclease T2 family protein [Candidatus Methylocalor cossyra]|uniref:Ribonuclease T n=1 Tax=Candidatus Methylocalor cossyra TaxID=3108543 RepID=A0ABM9NHY4_9GAMM
MTQCRRLLGYLLLALVPPALPAAARLAEGEFLATHNCPAYYSKDRRDNPGNVSLVPGRLYPVVEILKGVTPEYYRLRIAGAEPSERWVSAECGEYPPKSAPAAVAAQSAEPGTAAPSCAAPPAGGDICRTCGAASYVLTLDWQPGQCASRKSTLDDSPECRGTRPVGPFTLRELRPEQPRCAKEFGFCGPVAGETTPFILYPPVPLSEATRKVLEPVLPGLQADTGVERHQWHKYGTCTGFSVDAYFHLAADLVHQFNQAGMADFMAEHQGNKIRREEFFQAIERFLGPGSRRHINIECNEDGTRLLGVILRLPADLGPGADLRALLQRAPRAGARGNCAGRFRIDTFAAG